MILFTSFRSINLLWEDSDHKGNGLWPISSALRPFCSAKLAVGWRNMQPLLLHWQITLPLSIRRSERHSMLKKKSQQFRLVSAPLAFCIMPISCCAISFSQVVPISIILLFTCFLGCFYFLWVIYRHTSSPCVIINSF